jgi:hypothetical protein
VLNAIVTGPALEVARTLERLSVALNRQEQIEPVLAALAAKP